jgi:hypothetical protein
LEGLRERRDNILIDIKKDEERKKDLETAIEKMKIELDELTEMLEKKVEVRNEFDRIITSTETAYIKVSYFP